jgi:hypothetical protein
MANRLAEVLRHWRMPVLMVECPDRPDGCVSTTRSALGPVCSACGALIERSISHDIRGRKTEWTGPGIWGGARPGV